MRPETIDGNMLKLSRELGFLSEFSFYLAGGTGLSLQTGHRRSFDFDFFTDKEFLPEELSSAIRREKLPMQGEMRRHGTLYCALSDVKTSFIFYDAPLIFPVIKFNSIYIADWRDIITEKLRTAGDRGQKKDFYDLYIGIRELGIDKIVEFSLKKYGKNINYFHLLKGLTYFEDADKNPDPIIMDKALSWPEIRNFFMAHSKDFENSFGKIIL
ncbi:MAG: nucleotidyl transferase AbiEii/AbiGii toxin family protein [Nitrospirae bacterium]|nr:nucleotidyl transferase AbiEii/AbiGii toxin family protein [Nitrospirota bacterium]